MKREVFLNEIAKMNFESFLHGQNEIYEKFRDTSKVTSEGITAHQLDNSGGYFVALRHIPEITYKIEEFNRWIAKVVPTVHYDSRAIHTTISDYGIKQKFSPDISVLSKLRHGVHQRKKDLRSPEIEYGSWLYNQNSIIIPGIPNQTLFEDSLAIQESMRSQGIELRFPWGAQITATRFTQNREAKELSNFFELMKSAPIIGKSRPFAIDVGYYRFNNGEINFEVFSRLNLNS